MLTSMGARREVILNYSSPPREPKSPREMVLLVNGILEEENCAVFLVQHTGAL